MLQPYELLVRAYLKRPLGHPRRIQGPLRTIRRLFLSRPVRGLPYSVHIRRTNSMCS